MALSAPWLADYQLLAAALLLGVMLALAALRQPAQRLAVAKSTLAALAALALLCALPGWSLVHLLSEPSTPVEFVASTPIETPSLPLSDPLLTPPEPSTNITPPSPRIEASAPSQPAAAAPAKPINWPAWLVAAYAAGSAAVTLWLITGAFLARRVRQQATPAPLELQELLQQICGPEKTPPQLLFSPQITAPVALGIRRPTILLPTSTFPIQHSAFSIPPSALPLPPSQLLPILAHEWAHLQHRDLHTLAATRLLLILLWPQPLYWLLRRTIRLDQETLADAAAADRAGRLDYAQQLLAWASSASTQRPPRLAGAVGLWEGPSQLKRRIALLLNEQFNVMRSCSTGWRRLCIALLAFAALALSLVTLQPSPVAGSDTPTPAVPEPAPEPADDNAGPAEPNVYAGVCVDEKDRPLSGVDVSLFVHGLIFFENGAPESIEPVAVATTDDAGTFRIENIAELVKHRGLDGPSKQVTIIAQAKGRATAGKHEMLYFVAKRGKTSLLRMPPAATMSGRITDVAGEPISEALVASGSGSYYIPHQGLNTRTDAEGRYRLDSLTPNAPGALAVRHPNHVSTYVTFPSLPTGLNVKLRRGSVIEGRVVYQSLDPNLPPSPAAGIRVWAAGVRPPDDGVQREEIDNEADGKPRAVTDADGRYELRGLAGLKYDVNCWSLDHVTAGLQDIEIGRPDDLRESGRTVQVPDMVLTDGAIVRIKLIDAGSSNPLPVKAGTQAFITPRRTSRADAGYSVQLSANVNEKSEAEIRLPAGRYTLSALIRAVADDPAWTSASDKITTASGEADFIEIKEGETVEVTVPMHSHFPSDINDLDSRPLWGKVQAPRYVPQQADADTSLTPAPPWASPTMPSTDAPVTLATGAKATLVAAPASSAAQTTHQSVGAGTWAAVPLEPAKHQPNALQLHIVDENKQPFAGVEATLYSAPSRTGEAKPLKTLATDDAGNVIFADVAPADQIAKFEKMKAAGEFIGGSPESYLVALKRPGLATALVYQSAGELALAGGKRTIMLRPAVKLSGRVTDPQGKPVAGAVVTAGGFSGSNSIAGVNAISTDAAGRFEFADRGPFHRAAARNENNLMSYTTAASSPAPQPGPAAPEDPTVKNVSDLVVTHPQFAVTRVEGGDVPGVTEVHMLAATSIAGRVVDQDAGTPVAGVTVQALGEPTGPPQIEQEDGVLAYRVPYSHSATVTTDDKGNYRLENLPAGAYNLWVDSESEPGKPFKRASQGVSGVVTTANTEPAQAPDIVVGSPATVNVQLVDAATGQPLQLDGNAVAVPMVLRGNDYRLQQNPDQRVPISKDGTFTFSSLPGRFRIGVEVVDKPGIAYRVLYRSPDDFDRSATAIDLNFGENVSTELTVRPMAQLEQFRADHAKAFGLLQAKKFDDAIAAFIEMVAARPDDYEPISGRSYAYRTAGRYAEALADAKVMLKRYPDDSQAKYILADLLATSPVEGTRDGKRALRIAEEFVAMAKANHSDPTSIARYLELVAAAHAELGDFAKAMAVQQEAIAQAAADQKAGMESRLKLYQSNKPFRREAPASTINAPAAKSADQGASKSPPISPLATKSANLPPASSTTVRAVAVPNPTAGLTQLEALDLNFPSDSTWQLVPQPATINLKTGATLGDAVQ